MGPGIFGRAESRAEIDEGRACPCCPRAVGQVGQGRCGVYKTKCGLVRCSLPHWLPNFFCKIPFLLLFTFFGFFYL